MEKIIKKEKISDWINNLLRDFKVFAPVLEDNIVLFKNIINAKDVYIDYKNSVKPASEPLLPQSETLFKFKKDKEKVEIEETGEYKNALIFGIHPCDVKSILIFDKVFRKDYLDNYYIQKRENTVLISIGCQEPDDTCFCTSFGIDPTNSDDTDISLFKLKDEYYVKTNTKKGESILNSSSELFKDVGEGDLNLLQERKKEVIEKIKTKLRIERIDEKLKKLFDDEIWYKISQRCIGCGICTFCCPTCYCFDIQDEELEIGGSRFRCWDSCQFKDFTQEASGHNPRPTKRERQRQRYFHKFNYFFERYADYACVGCGRCVRLCPVNIDVREIIREIVGGTR